MVKGTVSSDCLMFALVFSSNSSSWFCLGHFEFNTFFLELFIFQNDYLGSRIVDYKYLGLEKVFSNNKHIYL